MKQMLFVLFSSACLVSSPAFAGAGHDHGPKYGGWVREVGNVVYELVVKADTLTVHVSDHGKPVATEGAKATVTFYAGNEKTVIPLQPVGDNRMSGKGSFKVGVGVRAALAITLAGKSEARTTFNLK
jgi:hypothetical protein